MLEKIFQIAKQSLGRAFKLQQCTEGDTFHIQVISEIMLQLDNFHMCSVYQII